MEKLDIPVRQGGTIGATLWTAPTPKALVLLHPATAVTQAFYVPFASYLAGLGFSVLTYDYRGTGRSCGTPLRDCKVTMADWIEHDVAAVTGWAGARFPGLPLLAVGHSVGGHAIALSSASRALQAGVMVASHAGVTRTISGVRERLRVWCVINLVMPLACRVLGYTPGRRLGLGEDLPSSVMLQWGRWSRMPNYFYDDPAMQAAQRAARVHLPLLVLGFDDDPWANPRAVDALLRPLVNARIERLQFAPGDADVPAIGHMGFFRKRCEPVLWPQLGGWLLAQCAVREGVA